MFYTKRKQNIKKKIFNNKIIYKKQKKIFNNKARKIVQTISKALNVSKFFSIIQINDKHTYY